MDTWPSHCWNQNDEDSVLDLRRRRGPSRASREGGSARGQARTRSSGESSPKAASQRWPTKRRCNSQYPRSPCCYQGSLSPVEDGQYSAGYRPTARLTWFAAIPRPRTFTGMGRHRTVRISHSHRNLNLQSITFNRAHLGHGSSFSSAQLHLPSCPAHTRPEMESAATCSRPPMPAWYHHLTVK